MANEFSYDDKPLQELFKQMDVSTRLKALKGAFRREATKVKNKSVANLRSSGLHSNKTLEKGIRAAIFKKKAGFNVTIFPKGQHGMYKSQRAKRAVPVLIFAEGGTKERRTKNRLGILGHARKGHSTGRMRAYEFQKKTLEQSREPVTNELREELIKSVVKVSERYGCR